MPNRETHKTDEFTAVDDDGNVYTVIEYQEVMERRSVNKPSEWIKTGPRWFRLDDDTPVNQIDADTFKIATTDMVIRRAR